MKCPLLIVLFFHFLRPFHNSDKLSISELKLAKSIVFKLIEKQLFSRFCSLYPGVFSGSTPELFRGYEIPSLLRILLSTSSGINGCSLYLSSSILSQHSTNSLRQSLCPPEFLKRS